MSPIGEIETKGELTRHILEVTRSPDGKARRPPLTQLPELAAVPTAPLKGCLIYCLADNGGGKREVQAIFPTGAAQVLATEP